MAFPDAVGLVGLALDEFANFLGFELAAHTKACVKMQDRRAQLFS